MKLNHEQEQWIFVRGLHSRAAIGWCWEHISNENWNFCFNGFLFKHERDAIMYRLKWS